MHDETLVTAAIECLTQYDLIYYLLLSVFVTGNKIYMVGHRITSVMVAQDARKGHRVLDRFGPSGGGNTLRLLCGCIIPMLRCTLGLQEAIVV